MRIGGALATAARLSLGGSALLFVAGRRIVGTELALVRATGAAAERIGRDTAGVLDPRPTRLRRKVSVHGGLAQLEVRGLTGPRSRELARAVQAQLAQVPSVAWTQTNAVTGRVAVGLRRGTFGDPAAVEPVLDAVRAAESTVGTTAQAWPRDLEYPDDLGPLIAATLGTIGDLAGLGVATAGWLLRVPPAPRALNAALALVDAQPRARRHIERRIGASATDLTLGLANAGVQALSRGGAVLVIDAGQRGATVAEKASRYLRWRQLERRIYRPGGENVRDPLLYPRRPCPLPAGPIERFADQASVGSLVAAGAALVGRQRLSDAADAVLVGVPRATRTSRESFAAVLATLLTLRGTLALDPGAWRRLDRVDTLVVATAALRGHRPLVLAAEPRRGSRLTREALWSEAQRLLAAPPPPPGAVTLDGVAADRPGAAQEGEPVWRDVRRGGAVLGRVLVGVELDPSADSLLATARDAGLTVILTEDAGAAELRPRADRVLAAGVSLADTVRDLQRDQRVVAVVSRDSYRALAAADVGIGLFTAVDADRGSGAPTACTLPWTADLICRDLAGAASVVAAIRPAREVSERGRSLALSASVLGGLLLAGGRRRPVRNPRLRWAGTTWRASSPVTAAALLGLFTGTRAGLVAGRHRPPADLAPLVPWHALDPEDVLSRLPAATAPSAAAPSAPGRTAAVGPLVAAVGGVARGAVELGRHVRQELDDPLTPILSVGAAASAVFGAPTDAVLVAAVMAVNAVVSAVQRLRAARALQGLLAGEVPVARRVGGYRSPAGERTEAVPADRLHPGDIIDVAPGDVVPADARLLDVDDLELDESGLTGESVTVNKQVAATPGVPVGERACLLFEGTTVVAGRGRAVVVAVGAATQAGRAAAAVGGPPRTGGVAAQLRSLTSAALPLTLGGGATVTLLGLIRGRALRAALADGIAVAVAAVPEGLPLVATVAQLAAARRLSQRGVLVRNSRTVEALGRVDTVCFDKTGTLTEGRLRLVALADHRTTWRLDDAEESPDARRLLRAAVRACPNPSDGPVVHATDRAVIDGAGAHLYRQGTHVWDPLEELPFESNRGYAASVGQTRRVVRLVVKGAPEVVLPRCRRVLAAGSSDPVALTAAQLRHAERAVHVLASRGLRVLAVARRDLQAAPDDVEAAVESLTLLGFLGLADTPREGVPLVLSELARSGLTSIMITGDHPVTAAAIAQRLGIDHEALATGTELNALDDVERRELIDRTRVFARVTPEQKVRIVAALQQSGRVVAMTGDGSNDAAAIRLADVGVALAAQGSASARHAADLVLTRPDLSLLLEALVEGRAMWQRVRDAVAVLVGGNAGEVAFTVAGAALTGRAPVGTRQFLLVNLLTDMFPAMAVALARPRRSTATALLRSAGPGGEDGAVRSTAALLAAATRAAGDELADLPQPELGRQLMRSIVVRGAATAAGAGGAWLTGRATGRPRRASTMGLAALVGTQLGQTVLLGWRSPTVWVTAIGSGAVLVGIVQTPGLSQFFGCTPLGPVAWTAVTVSAAGATTGSVVLPRVVALLVRR